MQDPPISGPEPRPSGDAVRAYGTMNTLQALERLAVAPRSAPELAAELRVSDRTARRILQRLALEGYAVQEGGHHRRYRATMRLLVVGRRLLEHARLPAVAAPWVAELARQTAAQAHLWIAADARLLCLAHADGACTREAPIEPAARELSLDEAAAAVIGATPRRSCVYIDSEDGGAVAAAIVENGAVVAALGVTGGVSVSDLAPVVRAARSINRSLGAPA